MNCVRTKRFTYQISIIYQVANLTRFENLILLHELSSFIRYTGKNIVIKKIKSMGMFIDLSKK